VSDPELRDRVAAAVAELDGLAATPLAGHHDRLDRAHEVLHRALQDDPDPPRSGHGQARH